MGRPKSDLNEDLTEEGRERIEKATLSITERLKATEETVPAIEGADGSSDVGRLRRAIGHIPAPLTAKAGERELPLAAAQRVKNLRQAMRAKELGTGPEAWRDKVSFIRCTLSDCLGPGIWIEGDPTRPLEADNWWSSYKAKGMEWPPERAPHCQCCWAEKKQRVPLRIFFDYRGPIGAAERVGMQVNPRFIETISREEYDAAVSPAPVS